MGCSCEERRKFVFWLGLTGGLAGLTGLGVAGYPFLKELNEEIKRKAALPITIDLSKIKKGSVKTVFWNRKPVIIKYLNDEDIAFLKQDNQAKYSEMLDPEPALKRISNDKWLILSGICTHLGCAIKYVQQEQKFRCACHGSFFDNTGRVINGPASVNLIIPPHRFIDDKTLMIGEEMNLEKIQSEKIDS